MQARGRRRGRGCHGGLGAHVRQWARREGLERHGPALVSHCNPVLMQADKLEILHHSNAQFRYRAHTCNFGWCCGQHQQLQHTSGGRVMCQVLTQDCISSPRFRAAAEQNHAGAQYGLGYMHLAGHGVAMDHRKAYKYFSAAAEQVNMPNRTLALSTWQQRLPSTAVLHASQRSAFSWLVPFASRAF